MYGFRHKFFKIVAEPLGDEHLKIPSVPSSYEKMNYLIFELDNLVGSGKMSKSKATQVLTKIIKGTR
jgi:polyhydroxyalkanoate synthesis regulator phasin